MNHRGVDFGKRHGAIRSSMTVRSCIVTARPRSKIVKILSPGVLNTLRKKLKSYGEG
ncbi:MAG: hypothetical protein GY850_10385 [bacterium]|nr:hypothetical protein [bacterium]